MHEMMQAPFFPACERHARRKRRPPRLDRHRQHWMTLQMLYNGSTDRDFTNYMRWLYAEYYNYYLWLFFSCTGQDVPPGMYLNWLRLSATIPTGVQ